MIPPLPTCEIVRPRAAIPMLKPMSPDILLTMFPVAQVSVF